jgi:CubicO group peptidase (beta-lactamase class C family)
MRGRDARGQRGAARRGTFDVRLWFIVAILLMNAPAVSPACLPVSLVTVPPVAVADGSARAVRPPRRRLESQFSWPRTSPEAQGLDSGMIASYRSRVAAGEFGPIHSLLILRHGAIVEESYFGGWQATDLHSVYSVTKSVTALLYGIGLERGLFPAPSDPVVPLFPEYATLANAVPSKYRITVDDLLTMRAGFTWNEGSVSYLDPSNVFFAMENSRDWLKFVLDQPMEDEPGTKFRYSSGASVLLGGIIHNASGQQPADLARDWLFRPLGILRWQWGTAPPGVSNRGFGLSLLPLDMARIGELVLHDGSWRGVQIVPADWVRVILSQHVALTQNFGYGEQWWIMPLVADLASSVEGNQIWLAWGFAGQYIFVVPALDTVIVSTAGCDDETCEGAMSLVPALLASAVIDK